VYATTEFSEHIGRLKLKHHMIFISSYRSKQNQNMVLNGYTFHSQHSLSQRRVYCSRILHIQPQTPVTFNFHLERKSHLMYPTRPILIKLRPTQETLTEPLIHHKNNLRCNLAPQKHSLLVLFPLGEVSRRTGCFDTRRTLAVAGVLMHTAGVGSTGLQARVQSRV